MINAITSLAFSSLVVVLSSSLFSFSPCLDGSFVFDDLPAVVENKDVWGGSSFAFADVFEHDFWGENAMSDKSHRSYRPLTTIAFRDGIHQIVSRFLERFRYMCPLLFSCVFPS
jgi:hypothetical protein